MTYASALPGQPRGGSIGGPATDRSFCVLAPNASPMTLDGTNTWIVAEPDSDLAVVIDPGPLDDAHLKDVIATVERAGRRVALTLLTHGHPDHAERRGTLLSGARRRRDVAVWAVSAALRDRFGERGPGPARGSSVTLPGVGRKSGQCGARHRPPGRAGARLVDTHLRARLVAAAGSGPPTDGPREGRARRSPRSSPRASGRCSRTASSSTAAASATPASPRAAPARSPRSARRTGRARPTRTRRRSC
ncbi:hypothetical protein SANTM175S_10563 [Streptomyces antimycoticus]